MYKECRRLTLLIHNAYKHHNKRHCKTVKNKKKNDKRKYAFPDIVTGFYVQTVSYQKKKLRVRQTQIQRSA